MKIRKLMFESFAVGLASLFAWVVIWGSAFPDVWSRYEDYVLWVFGLSSIAYFAYRVKPLLFRRR